MAEIMFVNRNKMDRDNEVSKAYFNHEDIDVVSELSDDSDIEILTPNNFEESASVWSENNLKNTREINQKYYLESLETKDESSTGVEIINLSSDDEETNTFEENILESKNETIDYTSEGSESSYEQIEIEIETDNEEINIKQNSHLNLDELFLGSDEECVMFDFSNYSADDVLKAVENNKLLTDQSVTQNTNVEITENDIESKIEIEDFKIEMEESKISSTDIKTGLDIGVRNKNIKNKTDATEISSDNNIQSTCHINESVDCKRNNDVISETQLILKCRKCGSPSFTEININISNSTKRKCSKCSLNMSFQCKTCTCLFHSIFSFYNHLKNYHMRENEKILQTIDNLHLKNNTIKRRKKQKVKKEQKVKKVQKLNKGEKKKMIYKCVNCAQRFLSVHYLQIHRNNCHIIPYLYCRFCPLNIQSIEELREHMIRIHSSIINQSDLNQILHGIEQEGCKIIDMKSILLVTCVGCKNIHQLNHRERQCNRCRSSLIYKCGERKCELMFNTLGELTCHVRQHHLHTWHRCNICGAAFSECAEATRHRLLHHPENRVTYRHCENCHYEASSPGDMSSHVHSAHKAVTTAVIQPYLGPYVCNACGNIFKLEYRLRKHQRSFCRKICKMYGCAHCRYTSFDKHKLLQHLRCSHVYVFTGRKLKCHRCGVELASIYKLNSHMGNCKVKMWR